MTRLEALRALLSLHRPLSPAETTTPRVIYAAADDRIRLGDLETRRARKVAQFLERAGRKG